MSKLGLFSVTMLGLSLSLSLAAQAAPGFLFAKELKGRDDHGDYEIHYVQIRPSAFPNDAIRRHVNAQLAEIARETICDADPANRGRMESNLTMSAPIANSEALSIRTSQDYYCGGAHPDGGTTSYLFNLSTGKQETVESQMANLDAFKAVVMAAVQVNAPTNDDMGCSELFTPDHLADQSYEYTVRENELIVTQDFPHAMQACAFETEIPASQILSLVKAGSLLTRIMK